MQKGQKYIDFSAPDFEGNRVTLSEKIKGKAALIDLWASWCLPCRRTSLSMIPVYEEYKDKGFTIVGVARESNPRSGIEAATKDGYPWLNLLEVDNENKIWEKYGITSAAGIVLLVDHDGKILSINQLRKKYSGS